jgi:hypothetical protein
MNQIFKLLFCFHSMYMHDIHAVTSLPRGFASMTQLNEKWQIENSNVGWPDTPYFNLAESFFIFKFPGLFLTCI